MAATSTTVGPISNLEITKRWINEVWNECRTETAHELMAHDAVVYGLGEPGVSVRGPDAFLQFFATIRTAFPDLHMTIEHTVTEGDWVCVRFSTTGSYRGGLGFPGNGKRAQVSGLAMVRLAEGKIVENWAMWDQRGMLLQIGAPENIRLLR